MGDKAASPIVSARIASAESNLAVPSVTSKKTTAAPKSKKAWSKPSHPRTSEMVNAAIKSLKERSGSSLQAIKKYVSSTYKVDAEKHAPFIKRYLKTAVASGALVQTKGKGASGSFKLASTKVDTTKPKAQRSSSKTEGAKKKAAVKKPVAGKKTTVAKKSDVSKKATATTKKPVAVKKSTAATKKAMVTAVDENRKVVKAAVTKTPKTKNPSKVKKVTKAPTTKPKAPKPKKAVPAPKSAKPSSKKPIAQKKYRENKIK